MTATYYQDHDENKINLDYKIISYRYSYFDINNNKEVKICRNKIDKQGLLHALKEDFKNLEKTANPYVFVVKNRRNRIKGFLLCEMQIDDGMYVYWQNCVIELPENFFIKREWKKK